MKKILLTSMILLIGLSVNSEVFKARTLESFDTKNPSKEFSIKALNDMVLGNLEIKEGFILKGEVIEVIPPQAYGKNATFSLKLVSFQDLKGNIHNISGEHIIKYRQKLKPNWERQSFSLTGSSDGGRTETDITFSPYDVKLMKESKSVGEFLWKDMTKDSFWQPGWDLKYKTNEVIYFNY